MNASHRAGSVVGILLGIVLLLPSSAWAQAKAWVGAISIPTYVWEEDVNPQFWALEGATKLSTTVKGQITYPYTMQDHLSRTKVDRTYKAVFLENEYLKVTCLPELGGRLHSVFDKTTQQEMFHLNHAIKPGMIALRGAFISGGVEWNAGPQGHTVTIVSPVDVVCRECPDGAAFIEVNNQEKIFRTRWTVRVTLRPGKAYLEERIRIANPTDGMHPYYFWNCTAFPNRPGTRFIYPMTLGTDHSGTEFFHWPIHKGKDLTWLKNYEIYTSVFAYKCDFDFFGAYDVDADRGIVSTANHHEVRGKKAWTWGEWDFGKVAQKNLTDDDGPYIEVQSGPLPTQSDYGLLGPHDEVSWQEYWYPVHGLGDGFEFATKDVAVQTSPSRRRVAVAPLGDEQVLRREVCRAARRQGDSSPRDRSCAGRSAANCGACGRAGTGRDPRSARPTAKSWLGSPRRFPSRRSRRRAWRSSRRCPTSSFRSNKYISRGRSSFARPTASRPANIARRHWPGTPATCRRCGPWRSWILRPALYPSAIQRLEKALDRYSDDGLSWYFLGASHLRQNNLKEALRCGYRARGAWARRRWATIWPAGPPCGRRILRRRWNCSQKAKKPMAGMCGQANTSYSPCM